MSTSSRLRVWVKEHDGAPTRVSFEPDDLIDDVKSSVLQRYANSLGRVLDAPSIGLRISAREGGGKKYRERLLDPGEEMVLVLQNHYPNGQTAAEALVIEVLVRASPGAWMERVDDVYTQQVEACSPRSHTHKRPTPPSRQDSAWSMQSKIEPGSMVVSPGGQTRLTLAPHSPGLPRFLGISGGITRPQPQQRSSMRNDANKTIQESPIRASGAIKETKAFKGRSNASTMPPINVLLVDDNSVSLNVLAKRMRGLKVRYETATNGAVAVEKWKAGRFHIIFMDLRMPTLSGVAATKEIRKLEKEAQPLRPPVIIVALTASSLPSDRDEALAAGCNDFLTKPPDLPWLDRKVQEWGCMQALIDSENWRQSKGYEATT